MFHIGSWEVSRFVWLFPFANISFQIKDAERAGVPNGRRAGEKICHPGGAGDMKNYRGGAGETKKNIGTWRVKMFTGDFGRVTRTVGITALLNI